MNKSIRILLYYKLCGTTEDDYLSPSPDSVSYYITSYEPFPDEVCPEEAVC
jgi:hypothetical protein